MTLMTRNHLKALKPARPSADTWCFCKDSACDGWDLYRGHHLEGLGVEPTDEDIALDRVVAEHYTEMVTEASSAGDPRERLADFLARASQPDTAGG